MGRPALTKEAREAKVPEKTRTDLLVKYRVRNDAAEAAVRAELELHQTIAEVVSPGEISFRDVAAVLDVPYQSVHNWIKRNATVKA